MTINQFSNLIRNLPVLNHAVLTKFSKWESAFSLNIPSTVEEIFGEDDKIRISRKEIFETQELTKKIFMSIFWGYPEGMRNNYHNKIFSQIEEIKDHLENTNVIHDWTEHIRNTNFEGIKLSTYSKLLYFNKTKVNDTHSLILDGKIIDCINRELFSDFHSIRNVSYYNAPNLYPAYLNIIKTLAEQNDVREDQIEFFLFLFGNKIK